MNSGVLGERGCKHMPSFAFQTWICQLAVAVHLPSFSSPAVPGMLDAHAQSPFSSCNKTNRFGNFFSFRGPWCLYRLCVIWAPFLFCRTFLYLLIHLRLPAALMLVTAKLPWFCHRRSSKGGVVSLWFGLQGLWRAPAVRWKGVKQPRVHTHNFHGSMRPLKASLPERRGTLTDKLSVNVQYSSAELFWSNEEFSEMSHKTHIHWLHL